MVLAFDCKFLQPAGVGIDLRHVVGGQKGHLVAEFHEGKHVFHRRIGAGVLIRRAYFIDDTVPTPDQDAGSNAAIAHMRAIMELGYKVTFLPADNMTKIDPYTARLQKLGIECQYHPFFWSVEEVFRKAANKPDLVYLHRYSNASKYATMVRRYFPDCRIVYNVADLHFLRMERQAEIEPGTLSASHLATRAAQRDGGDAERGLRHRALARRGGAAARNRSVAECAGGAVDGAASAHAAAVRRSAPAPRSWAASAIRRTRTPCAT